LRPLAVTTAARSPSAPEIPTMQESGVPELKDFAVENYYGFMAPAGVPAPIAQKLVADIRKVLETPEMKAKLSAAGLDLYPGTPEQMIALLRADIEKFRKAIAIANIKPE
jgi:tripartite-type tricarboxylate transporter receptor subunit TctC